MNSVTLKLQKGNALRIKKLEKFSFLLGGIILLIPTYDRYQSDGGFQGLFGFIYYAAYIAGGLVNILAGIFYSRIPEKKKDSVARLLQIIISVLLLFDSIDKFMKGKIAMPFALIFVSILYFIVAIFTDKLKGRRFITISKDKILFRRSLFKTRTISVSDIKDISFSTDKIVLELNSNKTISFFPADNDAGILELFENKLKELNNKG